MSIFLLLLIGLLAMALWMAILFFLGRGYRNAGIVDAGWAAGLAILALFYAAFADGLPARRILLAFFGFAWGARLAAYLYLNRVRNRPEDGRYEMLRTKWGERAFRNFFIFFQIQATWDILFSLPFLAVAYNSRSPLGWADYLGVLIWIFAVVGEFISDRQLAAFRAREENQGKTCNVGLWRYSRHPNYFFEWLHWFAYIPLALGSPYWWLSLLGPVVMGVFLWKITGIPYTEKQALRSRGESYREYQRTTSAFIPWFPRKKVKE